MTKSIYYSTPVLLVLGGIVAATASHLSQKSDLKEPLPVGTDLRFLAEHLTTTAEEEENAQITVVDVTTKADTQETKATLPSDYEFCGERVPMEHPYVTRRLTSEIAKNCESTQGMKGLLKLSGRYQKEIVSTLKKHGLPEDFFYLAVAESGLSNATSPRGAKGFWQFMSETARIYGLEVNETVDERLHPQKSTEAACKYLKSAHRNFGDWALAAAAYNAGEGGIGAAVSKQQIKDYYRLNLRSETENYVYRILALKYVMSNPEKYGIRMNDKYMSKPIPYKSVKVSENIEDLSAFAAKHGSNYFALKMMNPWLIAKKLKVKPGKTYEIRFPNSTSAMAKELLTVPFDPSSLGKNDLMELE
ncbi:MAG: lytic transglycosylase domain-containing protein [Bacteroidia bacterium]